LSIFNKKPVFFEKYKVEKTKVGGSSDEDIQYDIPENFAIKLSGASCKVSEIKSIIYGGISSRFWLFRKHLNQVHEGNWLEDFKK